MGNGYALHRKDGNPAVHPHAYGERAIRSSPDISGGGSSPRIWGTDRITVEPVPRQRFIPTHMGNGHIRQAVLYEMPVHPHAYGERAMAAAVMPSFIGSSPRIWGTVLPLARRCSRHRFIPTHMGNGSQIAHFLSGPTVHPHAYGERIVCYVYTTSHPGSSPRIWGTGTNII